MINQEYSEAAYKRQELSNKKEKTRQEQLEFDELGEKMTHLELFLSSNDIIESVKDAFKHIPSRL